MTITIVVMDFFNLDIIYSTHDFRKYYKNSMRIKLWNEIGTLTVI